MLEQKCYNLKQASMLINTPVPYLRKMIREHKLNGHFIGRQYIVYENELDKFVKSRGVKNER